YKIGPFALIWMFIEFLTLKQMSLRLKNLSKTRICLHGFASVFDQKINMALSLQDIDVCSAQERLNMAFFPSSLIIDHYFIISSV
ncbi:MAG: hypothetical protein ABEH43_09430, partial [Flavobacteriales bacterium]